MRNSLDNSRRLVSLIALSALLLAFGVNVLSPRPMFSHTGSLSALQPASGLLDGDTLWEWETATPESIGLDSTKLDEIPAFIESRSLEIDSVVVVRRGQIGYEFYPSTRYSQNSLHAIASCTKSVVSMLLGITLQEGLISDIGANLVDFYPELDIENLDERKSSITLEHLLTMTAGLEWDQWSYDYEDPRNSATQMYSSVDPIRYVLDLPMASEPGSEWVYSCGAAHLILNIIERCTGKTALQFAMDALFGPLGITNVYWAKDSAGNYKGGGGLYLSPRDMTKIGLLCLQNGLWDGEQIIPSEWVAASAQPRVDLDGYSTTIGPAGYGLLWWIAPYLGIHYASGIYGQRIYIHPVSDLVVVFTASTEDYEAEASLLTELILPAVKDTSGLEYSGLLTQTALLLIPVLVSVLSTVFEMRKHTACNSAPVSLSVTSEVIR